MTGPRRGGGGWAPPPPDPEQDGPAADPEGVARTICLRLLDHRARSRGELAGALRKRGVPDDAAARVLDRLTEVGLIDDLATARSMAQAQHRERGLARRAVAAKLRTRGFADEAIDSAVAGIDAGDERERAAALVARRRRSMNGLEPQVQARRLIGMLARKGYPAGVAHAIVRAELGDVPGAPAEED